MKLIANQTLPPQAQAFLMALYVGESGGDYGILYGGGHFDAATPSREGYYGFPDWPGKDNSHGAGAPQFEPATWKAVCENLAGRSLDFRKPEDQDRGAWLLAQNDFFRAAGRDLLAELTAAHLQGLAAVLKPTWTSLSEGTFPERYAAAWALITVGVPQTPPQPSPAPAATAAPQEGIPMNALAYIGRRMSEASSYSGLAAIVLGAAHVANATDLANAAIGAIVAIGGLIGVLAKEKGAAT